MSGFIFTRKKKPAHSASSQQQSAGCSEPLVQTASDAARVGTDGDDRIVIDNFDSKSRRSLSSSLASLSKVIQLSQTYFSAESGGGGNKNDETTSFYSALQDGFSLNDYESPASDINFNPNLTGHSSLLWVDNLNNGNERDSLMNQSNFQVYWHDIVYKIKPKITLTSLWYDLEQKFVSNASSALSTICCSRSKSLTINAEKALYKNDPVTIIENISGSFKSGELTAVMGPSGAGKTSLLNFLSRRREEGYTGEMYVDSTSNRRIKISTIPQSDHLPEYLTVRENLTFASRLKNTHHSGYDHVKNVQKVSNLLGLDDCLDTRTKRISGGQHKRLAIAQELLSRPDILILDEPTSGLDSLTCYRTLSVLKNLVQASAQKMIDPIAIVITIHQPQQEVFDLFDKIYVMANGGLAIYNGPPDTCIPFIEEHTGIQLPDKDYNPASFMIEIASGEYGIEPIKALESQVKAEFSKDIKKPGIPTENNRSILDKRAKHDPNSTGNADKKMKKSGDLSDDPPAKSSLSIDSRIAKGSSMNRGNFFSKTLILTERCWTSILRDPKQMIGRIIFHILLPFMMALIVGTEPGRANACPKFAAEYKLKDLIDDDRFTSEEVQNEMFLTLENIGTIFITMYALTCANIAATTLTFTLDMTSSLKEFYNGWYTMPSYMLARFFSDIPMEIILPLITVSLTYPLTGQLTGAGLSDVYRILLTAAAIILGSMVGQTMGMIFGAIYIGHVSTALFASQASSLPMVFLSGFIVRTKNMSKWVYTLSKFSFFKHTLEVASIARYGYNVCNCKASEITGNDAQIAGVPERFQQFTKYMMNAYEDPTSEIGPVNDTTKAAEKDLFQLFAKQVSLYNTYGIDVKSCDDVKPYQLYDLKLSEGDIPTALLALVGLLVLMKIILFFTVKLVIHFRTSL